MQQGLLGRISRSPILEYHLFGIISESKDAEYHYFVAGVQGALLSHWLILLSDLRSPIGDFTKSLVSNPPTHLWTRELKVHLLSLPLHLTTLPLSNIPSLSRTSTRYHHFLHAPNDVAFQIAGVSNTSTLYKRGIRICTGTGIGAALSTCLQSPNW